MTKIKIEKAKATAKEREILTTGMVGAKIAFSFDEEWNGLKKTAVFSCGDTLLDVPESEWVDGVCTVPHECMTREGRLLTVGVYGINSDGSIAIPTMYVSLGRIWRGADPSGNEGGAVTLPIWLRLSEMVGDLSELETEDKSDLVAAINEVSGGLEEHKVDGEAHGDIRALIRKSLVVAISEVDGHTTTFVADKTFDEIMEACESGAEVKAIYLEQFEMPLVYRGDDSFVFNAVYDSTLITAVINSDNNIVDMFTQNVCPKTLPNPTALTIKSNSTEQSYNGSAAKSIIFPYAMPQFYGALGNGTTDDTAAIQSALANNRYVYIPAGTYKLSGTLNIRDGCRLELAPDAILNFTQTSGNCITLGMSAQLNGNFATLVVPYAFSGNVIYISTASSTTLTGVPPYTRWTPQWKPARYVSDICITKPDSRGFHYSVDGTCSGTAVYIEADGSATSTFIWGARLSGLRIAGAFSYGVHGKCLSEGWNHEMHLEAVIDACEIGVCLEDSNNNYITATIQPRAALTTDSKSVPYAKHGIQLIRCRNTDLSETRVWDWNATNALWTEGGEYQHIAMVGNCSGTILSDFLYYETNYDIRSLIYTDTASNFEKMTILQEPFTRWFKPSEDGLTPYFYNGTANKELLQKDAFDALFQTNPVANFTNKLPTAATADGSVFNSVGYKSGVRLADADGTTEATLAGNTITGFIPCAEGNIIRLKGISFATNTYSAAKLYLYKSDHTKLVHVNHSLLTTNGSYYNVDSYEATDEGCSFRIVNGSAAYFRLSVDTSTLTTEPVVTVNEEISYSQAGFLADSVSVKASSVYGLEDYIKAVIAATISDGSEVAY